ncbi:MAG: serine hydrolase [Deltaproteobacteria bacterium]|nr:serine hydrolase [Deltaproteobacteria bacterium]
MEAKQLSYQELSYRLPAQFSAVTEMLEQGIVDDVFPGAVLLVGRQGDIIYANTVGARSLEEDASSSEMRLDTVFDIASLTQPVVTTTLIMHLLDKGKLKLTDKVCRYIQTFSVHNKGEVTIEQLLNHTSGLVHWYPYFEEIVELNNSSRMGLLASSSAKDYVYNIIHRSQLKYKPGQKQVFSDIGFIILGEIIEVLTGYPLEKAAQKLLFQPLSMRSTSFIDLSLIKRGTISANTDVIAPTEQCSWRKKILCGEVHDDNAWAMGGVSGHAGCFSNAFDLHNLASHLLAAYFGEDGFVSEKTVKKFWYPSVPTATPARMFQDEVMSSRDLKDSRYRYGWEGPHKDNGMNTSHLSPFAVGHAGFTGCSLWIEPEAGIDIVLLTNRVHPSRSNKKIQNFRPELHKAVVEAFSKLS